MLIKKASVLQFTAVSNAENYYGRHEDAVFSRIKP